MIKILLILLIALVKLYSQEIFNRQIDSIITDEILVESNRLKMSNSEAPNKLQVFDKAILNNLNGSRLPDAISLMDGVFIKDYGFNSGTKTISLNATQSEHTLILIDGVRLNSRQNAQYDLSLFDLNNVERIEISNGGLSALYGSEAIGGVVNIVTTKPGLKKLGVNFTSALGSFGYMNFNGRLTQSFSLSNADKFSYDISGSDERSGNYDFTYNTIYGAMIIDRINSDFNTQSGGINLRYDYKNSQYTRLYSNYSHFERGAPGPFAGYSVSTARQKDYVLNSGLTNYKSWNSFLSQKTDISFQYQLQKYFDTATYNLNTEINSFYKTNRLSLTSIMSYGKDAAFNFDAGGELNYDMLQSNETEDAASTQAAIFTVSKHAIEISESKLLIYPSVRYDYYSNISYHNVLTGKLGLNFQPLVKTELHIKSSFGNNFSAPTFNELYWKDVGNRQLKPERSISFDAGVIYRFRLSGENEFEFSYYNIYTTDRIVWTPVSGTIWRPLNILKARSEGISAGIRSHFELINKFSADIGFNYSYGASTKKNADYTGDPSFNKQLIYLPRNMIKSSIMLNYLTTRKFLKYVSFSLFYNYSSKRFTNFENTISVKGYNFIDANIGIGFRINKLDAGLRFIVNNLSDEQYSIINGYPMPGRNFKTELNIIY